MKKIATERTFAPTVETQLSDPDYLSFFGERPAGVKQWPDLLKTSPVVILGEGRSGKTYEFLRQVEKLRAEGKCAFFAPLERLFDEDFEDALEQEDVELFHLWKSSSDATGYFFLDALDELKLREGSLRKAAKKLQKAIGPNIGRANIVMSCRPSDWKSTIDQPFLNVFCEPKARNKKQEPEDGATLFLEIISKDNERDAEEPAVDNNERTDRSTVQLVSILPLSKEEIREFSDLYAPAIAKQFCSHIDSNGLWHLYRLPAEIMDALNQMQSGQALGSLEDQVSFGIQYKLQEQQPNKRQNLSLEKALRGAERIALAMFLLKCRSIRVDATNDDQVIDVKDVLIDWKASEQEELIGKTLFDASGVGAVRFHHRSTQEYLAAKRLQQLHKDGLSFREFSELLFSEIGAEKVVKPSMAPVAAWLSLWVPEIRKLVVEREPELLFRQGMPSALPLAFKADILTAYVKRYASKDWCRTGVDRENLKRVSDRKLGPKIRELWEEGYAGHDSREILLDFIWAGEISECTDLALTAALDSSIGASHQIYGAWGVIAAGTPDAKKTLADAVTSNRLSQRVIRSIVPQLVPEFVSIDTFNILVDTLDEVPRSVHGLNYAIFNVAESPEMERSDLISLRNHLSDAIWKTRQADCKMYQAHSSFEHYRDGLIAACAGTIPIEGEEPTDWACAVAIAVHFGERRETIIAKTQHERIWAVLQSDPKLRETYFFACLAMADEFEGAEKAWSRFVSATTLTRRGLIFGSIDHDWLLHEVSEQSEHAERGVIFELIKYSISLRDQDEFTKNLRAKVCDNDSWLLEIDRIRDPEPQEPSEHQLEMRRVDDENEKQERKRVTQWQDWYQKVLYAPDFLLSGETRMGTLYDVQKVIEQAVPSDNSWGHWNSSIVSDTFNDQFLEKLVVELSEFWRGAQVQLPSERPSKERHTTYHSWLLALMAVKAEAESEGWASKLSEQEAALATRIACIELNGFGSFLSDLEVAHPEVVTRVVVQEAKAQLKQFSETKRAEIFHDVFFHGTDGMKSAFSEAIAPQLVNIIASELTDLEEALSYAIRMIASHGSNKAKDAAVSILGANNPWPVGRKIQLLSAIDPEVGCEEFLAVTQDLSTEQMRDDAIALFAHVFGDRHDRQVPNLNLVPAQRRIWLVRDLVVRSYQAVRISEDNRHEGTYTPDTRDNAQSARSFLLDTLLDLKEPQVLAVIHELAATMEFSHMPDRLRQMAYEIAAQISDAVPYPLSSFRGLDRENAFVPHDNRSLFVAMMNRIDAFEHDILYAEDRPIAALRQVDQETDLRPFIANWLRGRDRGIFDFTQEAVVANEKRTDLRFHPKSMNGYGTVELKRETWSLAELESALRDQLVGQYLQHENCRVGCLLICQRTKKHWQNPLGGPMLDLQKVVEHLKKLASEITSQRPELHITVKGIDYS